MKLNQKQISKVLNSLREDLSINYTGNTKRKKIAEMSLDFCGEWVNSISVFYDDKEKSKKECLKYVAYRFKEENKSGSLLISFLIPIMIKFISQWIINKLIDNLYNQDE
jgi:hypothetical protein